MAEMVPAKLPARASRGEERLFSILQRLPAGYIVYYEPYVKSKYPDFIVIAPDLGVMVIEVKGWYAGNLCGATPESITVKYMGRTRAYPHPLRQVRNYMWNLSAECERVPAFTELLRKEGQHLGRPIFPFGHFVVLANMTGKQLAEHPLGDFRPLFDRASTMLREDLEAWEKAPPNALPAMLAQFFQVQWPMPPLTPRQVDILRAIIHPEIRLGGLPRRLPIENDTDAWIPYKSLVNVLDLRQERTALSIGEGHRVLFGVAGSGKTVVLIARARYLHDRDPQARVLLLCFNVALGAYLRQALRECARVKVHHFDGWAKANGVTRQFTPEGTESDDRMGARLLDVLAAGRGEAGAYDAVLIDEAQDFPPEWFSCVRAALKDPEQGDLIIVGDGQQGIRRNKAVTWSELGIQARGRTVNQRFDLDKNYRNSREIVALAAAFAAGSRDGVTGDILRVPLDASKTVRATGFMPVAASFRDRDAERQAIVHTVAWLLGQPAPINALLPNDLAPEEIGLLYPMLPKQLRPGFDALRESLRAFAPVLWLNETRANREKWGVEGIKIQTIDSSKGLQYRAVILMWADLLPRNFQDSDEASDRALLYVGLTRPEDCLVVTGLTKSRYLEELQATCLAETHL
ncbi:MAG: NERD domain-containing protein [Candidatus Hydrogenedentes bacterium]|nr:NERD domain-containing protein [Candidatus Hydrogenedentota bacterium]